MKKYQVISMFVLAAGGLAAQPAGAPPDQVTIGQAVQEAVEHNLNLLAERYNLSIADARIVTAKLRPNPVFSAGLDYVDFQHHFNGDNQGGPTEYNFRTDFILERGGKRTRRIEVAQSAREVAQLQLLNTMRTLVLDVQNAFVDVQQAKDNVALARENLQSFQSIVEVNATRVRAGDLAKVELLRTQVAALQFQSTVRQAESKLKIAANRLQTLMGRTVLSPAFEAAGSLRRDSEPVVLEAISTMALEARPDLLALRKDQARSQADRIGLDLARRRDFIEGHRSALHCRDVNLFELGRIRRDHHAAVGQSLLPGRRRRRRGGRLFLFAAPRQQ